MVLISFLQGERVAELILNHARANECQDVPQFKKEMAQLVDNALSNTLSLGKVLTQICAFLSCVICVSDAGLRDDDATMMVMVIMLLCSSVEDIREEIEFCHRCEIITILHHGLISIFFWFWLVLCASCVLYYDLISAVFLLFLLAFLFSLTLHRMKTYVQIKQIALQSTVMIFLAVCSALQRQFY